MLVHVFPTVNLSVYKSAFLKPQIWVIGRFFGEAWKLANVITIGAMSPLVLHPTLWAIKTRSSRLFHPSVIPNSSATSVLLHFNFISALQLFTGGHSFIIHIAAVVESHYTGCSIISVLKKNVVLVANSMQPYSPTAKLRISISFDYLFHKSFKILQTLPYTTNYLKWL